MKKILRKFWFFIYRFSLKYRKTTILLIALIVLLICFALILPFFANDKYKAVKVIDENTIEYNGYKYKRVADFLLRDMSILSVENVVYPSPSIDIVNNKNRLIGYSIRSWENNKYYIDDYEILVYHKRLYIYFMPRCKELFVREDFDWSNMTIELCDASMHEKNIGINYILSGNELIKDIENINIPSKRLCRVHGKISEYQEIWFDLYCDSNPNYYAVFYAYDEFEKEGKTYIYSADQDMINYLRDATVNFTFEP